MRLKYQFKDLKKQKKSYSGKKKAHTFKIQALIHSKTEKILSLCMSKGAVHDFEWALLHKDLKCKAPLIEPNLRRNLGKWST